MKEFNEGKRECISLTKNEPGALLYDWFLDEENSLCTVLETYEDSSAVLAHAQNVNSALVKLMEICDFSGEVFGNATEELKSALKEMGFTPVPFVGGI